MDHNCSPQSRRSRDRARNCPSLFDAGGLGLSEQLEQIDEAIIVIIVGSILSGSYFPMWAGIWFLPLLFLLVRPISVALGLIGSPIRFPERALIAWLGIRCSGSIDYLAYLLSHGIRDDLAKTFVSLTSITVAISIGVHGLSVTPLMNFYSRSYEHTGEEQES